MSKRNRIIWEVAICTNKILDTVTEINVFKHKNEAENFYKTHKNDSFYNGKHWAFITRNYETFEIMKVSFRA